MTSENTELSKLDTNKRKCRVITSCSMKFNTGNYESVDISKSLEIEFDFVSIDDIKLKSEKLDKMVVELLKKEAEIVFKDSGRRRFDNDLGVAYDEVWNPST